MANDTPKIRRGSMDDHHEETPEAVPLHGRVEEDAGDHQHHAPHPADFVGKVIIGFTQTTANTVVLYFSNGDRLAIEAEADSRVGVPMLNLCRSCAFDGERPTMRQPPARPDDQPLRETTALRRSLNLARARLDDNERLLSKGMQVIGAFVLLVLLIVAGNWAFQPDHGVGVAMVSSSVFGLLLATITAASVLRSIRWARHCNTNAAQNTIEFVREYMAYTPLDRTPAEEQELRALLEGFPIWPSGPGTDPPPHQPGVTP